MMDPTEEQEAARLLLELEESFVIQAGAGTGKTTTLEMLARSTSRTGTYVAFNRAIVSDARQRFPMSVDCTTAHGLAFKAIGHQFSHRLNTPRVRSAELAAMIDAPRLKVDAPTGTKILQPGFCASLALRAVREFCRTADLEPGPEHVPRVPALDPIGTSRNNDGLALALTPAVQAAWRDCIHPDGRIPWNKTHDYYLKLWSLGSPRVPGDFVLVDEAQDIDPAMMAALHASAEATGQQTVWVGDSCQAIYEWRGAVDALERVGLSRRCYLTRSFRFGQPIADTANLLLEALGAPLRLEGNPQATSRVGPVAGADVILHRTNAGTLGSFLRIEQQGDQRAHIVGGGEEVVKFARAANELREKGFTPHPDLACFDSWAEVVSYVADDPQGDDLALIVQLLEEYGIDIVLSALEGMIAEDGADVLVSTAHKAKGREWSTVRLAGDFPPDEILEAEEARLVYVALTRARDVLDPSSCAPFVNARAGKLRVR